MRIGKVSAVCFAIAMLGASMAPSLASAVTFGFTNITNNNAANAAIGEAQLSLDVTDLGSNQVQFAFFNAGPAASSITQIYYADEDSILSGVASIANGLGTSFVLKDANSGPNQGPGVLPGGNSPAFNFAADFETSATSLGGVQNNGINPGETISVVFDLIVGKDFSALLAALAAGSSAPDGLRIGIHVQGFANGGSESFINNPSPVPLPAAAWMLLGSLGGLVLAARRTAA